MQLDSRHWITSLDHVDREEVTHWKFDGPFLPPLRSLSLFMLITSGIFPSQRYRRVRR